MSRVITFSRVFPSYHPRKGEPTGFVNKILSGEKGHTIRAGNRWKVEDKFSPRVWSGKPYNSKQVVIAPDMEVKKTWKFEVIDGCIFINDQLYAYSSSTELLDKLAGNDGLSQIDLLDWFRYPKDIINHQIICWSDSIKY